MEKIDFKKKLSEFYSVKKDNIVMVDIPAMNYLMILGEGDPNTSKEYQNAVEALYALAYSIKFKIKKEIFQVDYGVMPLEGQWWTDDMNDFSMDNKEVWKWTMAIMQPDFVTRYIVNQCTEEVKKKKDPPSLNKVCFDIVEDGLSAQILHVGPYADEAPTIKKLHNYIHDQGYELTGKHREIYLNDPTRTAGEKLKTIIRQPVTLPSL